MEVADVPEVTCPVAGKIVLAYEDAEQRARWLRKTQHSAVQSYKCETCGGWHVGHSAPKSSRLRRRSRR